MNKDLSTRLKTAGILIAVYLIVVLAAGSSALEIKYAAFFIFLIFALVINLEVAKLGALALRSEKFKYPTFVLLTIPSLAVSYAAFYHLGSITSLFVFTIAGFIAALFLLFVISFIEGRYQFSVVIEIYRFMLPALVLVGLGEAALLGFVTLSKASYFLIWLTVVVALNDSAAYFIGKRYGKTPFVPIISPKKTLEGSFAGLVIGTAAGCSLSFLVDCEIPFYCFLVFTILLVIAAQIGDLLQSYIKRLANVKDSGTWLPGHGGLFDRADAILSASIILLVYLGIRSV